MADVNEPGIRALRTREHELHAEIKQGRELFVHLQQAAAKAQERVDAAERDLDSLGADLLGVQTAIQDAEEAAYARKSANQPDQPTNIPDHAVPWTPIEPAEGETVE